MTDGDTYDAPNQEVVRADGSGPADEGSGGSPAPEPDPEPVEANGNGDDLDAMTKDELITYAEDHGVAVTTAMSKAEIREAIDRR